MENNNILQMAGLSAGGPRAAWHFWMNRQWLKLLPTTMVHSFT